MVSPQALFESLFVAGVLWGLTFSLLVCIRLLRGDELIAYEPRRPVPWRLIDVLIAASLWIALQGGASYGMQKVLGLPSGDDKQAMAARVEAMGPILAADSTAKLVSFVLAVTWLKLAAGATWRDLGFDVSRLGYDVPIGAAAFGAILVPVYAIQAILTHWVDYEHPVMEMMKTGNNAATYLFAFAAAVVVAPLVEEFLFRVLLQGWLEAYWERTTPVQLAGPREPAVGETAAPQPTAPHPSVGPILVSALVFALMHFGLGPSPIPLFVLALVLGYLYRQTHRIWPSLVVHVMLNGCSLLMVLLGGG